MLLIISDLHLSDGSTGTSISGRAFIKLGEKIALMAKDASWRESGVYHPVSKVDVLLLGDIFDMIRSTRWQTSYLTASHQLESGINPTNVRPWDIQDPDRIEDLATVIDKIMVEILENNKDTFSAFRSIGEHGVLIPSAVKGQPDLLNMTSVPVVFHLTAGNHDWMFCCQHSAFNSIREKAIKAIGLSPKTNLIDKPFPHDSLPFPIYLQQVLDDHHTFARHGDYWDSSNFDRDKMSRSYSSFGDAFVIDWLCKFAFEIAAHPVLSKSPNYAEIMECVREMDNIRPFGLVFSWLRGGFEKFPKEEEIIMSIWSSLGKAFLAGDYPKSHRKPIWNFSSPYNIYRNMYYLSKLTLKRLSLLDRYFANKDVGDCCLTGAIADAKANPQKRFFVFGHMHAPEILPLASATQSNAEQFYINSGTWKPVHCQAVANLDDYQFVSYNMMTYVAIYRDGERGGCEYETWTGTLESYSK